MCVCHLLVCIDPWPDSIIMSKSRIIELICVYGFKRSIYDRLMTPFGKHPFNSSCYLSKLTSSGPQLKPEWVDFAKHCPVPISYAYLDNTTTELYYPTHKKTPCIVAKCTHNQYILLLEHTQLSQCHLLSQLQYDLNFAIHKKFLTF